jgi:hypothetical protein
MHPLEYTRYYNGSFDSYTSGKSGPTSGFGFRHAALCRSGLWQSYAITRVTFSSGTPPVITADTYGSAVNITC